MRNPNSRKVLLVSADKRRAGELALWLVQMGCSVTEWHSALEEFRPSGGKERPEVIVNDCLDQTGPTTVYPDRLAGFPVLNLLADPQHPFTKKTLREKLDAAAIAPTPVPAAPIHSPGPLKLNDRIFVRHKEKMVKLEIEHILYVEADSNYSRIFTTDKEYLLATTLKAMEAKLPRSDFYRIHRSYIVNLRQIDEVAETHLVINRKALPISKTLRAGLLKRLRTI